ncbi:MAG: hypothetical protein NTV51_00280 [Verrucomicrobia bacterium]|nr:hypothetical protein [Verrucomicrobiota bacterium]
MSHASKRQLLPRREFIRRLGWSLAAGAALIVFSLSVGMVGYHTLAGLSWVDAFLDASMILSGMGPLSQLHSTSAKIFAGCYALYSGIALLMTAGVVLAPVVHRALHKFHLEDTAP